MVFPTQPDYGLVESCPTSMPVDLLARDVEAMAAAILGGDGQMTAGANITGDITAAAGKYYLAAALGGSRTVTLPAATTVNSRIVILRTDVTANTLAIGSLYTMPASLAGHVVLRADGTNWRIEAIEVGNKFTANKRIIQLPLGSFTGTDGTVLAKWAADNAGTCGLWGDGTKAWGIRWNNTAGTTGTIMTSFKVPNDCDVSVAPVVKIKAAKVGATLADAVTFIVGMYAQTEAALYDAGANLGATTGAMTGDAATKTVQLVSATLTAFPAAASGMSLTINPTAAKLATDDVVIFDAWIEYTPALG